MDNKLLLQLLDSATIMYKSGKHFALAYDELDMNDKLNKREPTIFDDILSRCTGEMQERIEYILKCLPKIHTAILMSISEVIAENNRDLLKVINGFSSPGHKPK